jgi:hypothetical protein
MSIALIAVSNPSPALSTRAQEVQLIARACELAGHAIRSAGGATASGNITDTGAVVLGTWVYTAVAPN